MAFKAYLIEYKTGDIIREETIIGRPKVYQSIDGEHSADLVIKTTKAALDDDYEPYVKGMVIIEGTSLSSSSKVISAGPIDKSFIEAENNTIKIGLASALDYLSKVQIYPYKAVKDSDDAFTIAKGTTDTRAAQKLLRYPWEEGASSDSSDPAPPSHITVSQLSNGSHSTLKEAMKVYYSDGQNVYDAWTELQGIRWGLECAESWSITGSGSSASLRTKLLIYNRFASNKDPLPWKTLPESTMLRYTIEEEPYSITRVIAVSKDSDKEKKIDSDLQHRNKSTGLLLDAFESLSEEATSAEMSDVLSSRLTPEKYSYSTYEIDVFMDGNETDNIGEYLGVRINSGPRRLGSKSRVIGIDHELGSNKYTLEITTAWDARTYPMPSKKKRKDEAKKKKKKRKYRHQKPRKGTNPDYSDWKPGGKYPERPNTGGGTTPTPPTPSDPNDPKPVPDFPKPNDDWNKFDPKPEEKLSITSAKDSDLGANLTSSHGGYLHARRNETTFYVLGTGEGNTLTRTSNAWDSNLHLTQMGHGINFSGSAGPSSFASIDFSNFKNFAIHKIVLSESTGEIVSKTKLTNEAIIDSSLIHTLYSTDAQLPNLEGGEISSYSVGITDMFYGGDKLYVGITFTISWDVNIYGSKDYSYYTKTRFIAIDVANDEIKPATIPNFIEAGSEVTRKATAPYSLTINSIGPDVLLRAPGWGMNPSWNPGLIGATLHQSIGVSFAGYGYLESHMVGPGSWRDGDGKIDEDSLTLGYTFPIVEGSKAASRIVAPESADQTNNGRVFASFGGSLKAFYFVFNGKNDQYANLGANKLATSAPIRAGDAVGLGVLQGKPITEALLSEKKGLLIARYTPEGSSKVEWRAYDPNTRAYQTINSSLISEIRFGNNTVEGIRPYSVGNNIVFFWGSYNGGSSMTTLRFDSYVPGDAFPNDGGNSKTDLFVYSKGSILTIKTPSLPDGLSVKTTEVLIEDTTDERNLMSVQMKEKSVQEIGLETNGFSFGKKLKISWNLFASNGKFNQNLAGEEKPAYSVSTTITPQKTGTQKGGSVSVIDNWRNGQGPNS